MILKAGSRGKRLRMDLHRQAFTEDYLDGPAATDEHHLIVDVAFDHAPWEEV